MENRTWTWLDGDRYDKLAAKYYEPDNTSTTMYPSERGCAVSWYDGEHNEFWLFGGYGPDNVNNEGE